MIHELLSKGSENARTSKELAAVLGCDRRQVTRQIERERNEGQPICANSNKDPGYYIAKDANELQKYCKRLRHRVGRIGKTKKSLQKTLFAMVKAEEGAGNGKTAE
jgi:biotin operon repressor